VKKLLLLLLIFMSLAFLLSFLGKKSKPNLIGSKENFWNFQSIDTMKYSRDLARAKLNEPQFDQTIDYQVSKIAETGASHVAIATPYDPEFLPFLKRWVASARKHNLKVWFRGNFSGWEGWFDYKTISRLDHEKLVEKFILDNSDIFENGDYFSSCPECENGGPGDPRENGDVDGHRQFLIEEYKIAKESFTKIGKSVFANLNPMNGDVARIIMDKETTQALGGIVVIDHYVSTPKLLVSDIKDFIQRSGGKVILGEFGVPIPDVNGSLNEKDQADFIKEVLQNLIEIPEVVGINYWTSVGGSTQLWTEDGQPKPAVKIIRDFFRPSVLKGYVINEIGNPIENATVSVGTNEVKTNINGQFSLVYVTDNVVAKITATGYVTKKVTNLPDNNILDITLVKRDESLLFKIRKFVYKFFSETI